MLTSATTWPPMTCSSCRAAGRVSMSNLRDTRHRSAARRKQIEPRKHALATTRGGGCPGETRVSGYRAPRPALEQADDESWVAWSRRAPAPAPRELVRLRRLEIPLGLERGHAPRPRRGHGLTVHVVLDVAGGEDTRDRRLRRAGLHLDVLVGQQLDLTAEELRVRLMRSEEHTSE